MLPLAEYLGREQFNMTRKNKDSELLMFATYVKFGIKFNTQKYKNSVSFIDNFS